MKKIINAPKDVVEQMMNGMVQAHSNLVHRVGNTRVMARNYKGAGKVGIISGGGSGHEPTHAGFVGKGMLSAAIFGDVFTSPTPDQVYEAIKAADQGAGVFMVIKNYTGDVLNFEMAKEMAEADGIEVEFTITQDDVSGGESTYSDGRRGVAGTVLMHKILGYHAELGASLSDLKDIAEKVNPQLATMGLALAPATVPEQGKPGFQLGENEIELGIGIHGEPGYEKASLMPSKDIAKVIFDKLNAYLKLQKGEKIVVMVNGMGSTPLMEQYVFINDVFQLLDKAGVEVAHSYVGDFMTAIDMAGLSLTFFRLAHDHWLTALHAPVETIAW
jgi:dihydroxyacetone kinase-like protein